MNAATTGARSQLSPAAEVRDEWVDQDDEGFLNAAYWRLLGRAPDATGLKNYSEKLRSGVDRKEILAELRQSDEYRNRLVASPGLHVPIVAPVGTPVAPVVPAAASLQRLLAHNDTAFVACAYRTLLGREADPSGMSTYLRELRRGFSKLRILRSLRRSAEGQRWAVVMPGLDRAIRLYWWAGIPVFGWIAAAVWRVERDTPMEMALRRLENRLYVLGGVWENEWSPEANVPLEGAGNRDAVEMSDVGLVPPRPSIRPAGTALSILRTLPSESEKK